ncbi:MAG: bifunctional 23S rRNA (guanine(2069)-N(7))-methyltransferase RlmK/23S rRNA (guanine(2445)-N(2))-methyltransferase RlmL, partial [Pseudomonadota bacterium]
GWLTAKDKTLYDPMCGSGTLLIEAAQAAKNIPPNLHRGKWGFDHYLGHKKRTWQALCEKAKSEIRDATEVTIIGSDINHKLIDIARQNAARAGVADIITFKQGNVLQQPAPTAQGIILSNPPYGERLSSYLELLPFYYQWGKYLKAHYSHWQVSLICSEPDLLSTLKLKSKKKHAIKNGPLDCVFCTYELSGDNLQDFSDIADNDEFSNRIIKNKKRLKRWLSQANTNAYRIYDADLPNYNFAIDIYADWVIVQEYKAPKSIPEKVARQRLQHAILTLPTLLDVKYSNIAVKVRQRQRGQNQYAKTDKQNTAVNVYEGNATFCINPSDYLDVGLFLDHRITRQLFAQASAKKHVLNLFCYTGSASVHAALRGAQSVTSVDMSNNYLAWAKRNFALNELQGNYQFEQANCLEWVREAKHIPNQRYDIIFLDPPSFSNSKRMADTWDVQRDHVSLLQDVKALLRPNGEIFFSNNLRGFSLDEKALQSLGFSIEDITAKTIPEDFARSPKIHRCWILTA